jgi:hypothetical protein
MPGNKSSSWHEYNESLIERGRILIDVDFLKSANVEMNLGLISGYSLGIHTTFLDTIIVNFILQ